MIKKIYLQKSATKIIETSNVTEKRAHKSLNRWMMSSARLINYMYKKFCVLVINEITAFFSPLVDALMNSFPSLGDYMYMLFISTDILEF